MCNNRNSPKGGRRRGKQACYRLAQLLVLKCSARITYGKGKILCFPLQSQKVFGICLAGGLGEGLSPARKWVQQPRSGDWVDKSSCHGPEERMASFNIGGS